MAVNLVLPLRTINSFTRWRAVGKQIYAIGDPRIREAHGRGPEAVERNCRNGGYLSALQEHQAGLSGR
jgi:hypothetical protein